MTEEGKQLRAELESKMERIIATIRFSPPDDMRDKVLYRKLKVYSKQYRRLTGYAYINKVEGLE